MSVAAPALAPGTIGQIANTVHDVPRAVAFYRDTLGLRQLPIPAPPNLAFFDCDGIRLMLSLPEAGFDHPGSVLYFKVRDIHAIHRALVERGVSFLGPPHVIARMPDYELWMAFFRDPDENPLALMSEIRGEGAA
jgi:predicted enzyme related to lactoylglutathione lyase